MQEVKRAMTLPARRKNARTLPENEEHLTPDETDAQIKQWKVNKCKAVSRFNAELCRKAEAKVKASEQVFYLDEERKKNYPSQRPVEMTINGKKQ
jgi:hypothetical protein